MKKKDLDWGNLGFTYRPAEKRYVAQYKDGAWQDGVMSTDSNVVLNECACVLQYAQTCFEGMKAYTTEDGRIVCFRPDLNAKRMADTCDRLKMPVFPEERFVEAVVQTVRENAEWVPPFGSGAALYIRPVMYGTQSMIAPHPATEYEFRIFTMPVGPYYSTGVKPTRVRVTDYDRAAPNGTGHVKGGLNYVMSFYPTEEAHDLGFNENIYLDAATHTYVEESGSSNIIFITADGKLVTPQSKTILPSITRRSIVQVARDYLGMEVEERPVHKDEMKTFVEAGLCGTAAVISPIGQIEDHGETIHYPCGMEAAGPVIQKLYDTLTDIQMCRIPAPEGWVKVICEADE